MPFPTMYPTAVLRQLPRLTLLQHRHGASNTYVLVTVGAVLRLRPVWCVASVWGLLPFCFALVLLLLALLLLQLLFLLPLPSLIACWCPPALCQSLMLHLPLPPLLLHCLLLRSWLR
jgi:hypothetical protein